MKAKRRRHLPKKVERCVRAVKKKGGAYNPYAVCQAKRNPKTRFGFVICAKRRSGGSKMYLSEHKFTNARAPNIYTSAAVATQHARRVLAAYDRALRHYDVTVEPHRK